MAVESKITENKKRWTVGLLKDVCTLLSLERSGSREELCKRMVDYLSCPSDRAPARAPSKAKVIK